MSKNPQIEQKPPQQQPHFLGIIWNLEMDNFGHRAFHSVPSLKLKHVNDNNQGVRKS